LTNPDGAVFDADGIFWRAEWGAARVAAYAQDGSFLRAVPVGGRHSSCPAFGGNALRTLFTTTARQDLSSEILAAEPLNGATFRCDDVAQGMAEPCVIL
jgi:sugar lactone lactonase YvrE